MAGITIRSFDPKNIDSDLDTINTEIVRDKFKEFKFKIQPKKKNGKKKLIKNYFNKIKQKFKINRNNKTL